MHSIRIYDLKRIGPRTRAVLFQQPLVEVPIEDAIHVAFKTLLLYLPGASFIHRLRTLKTSDIPPFPFVDFHIFLKF